MTRSTISSVGSLRMHADYARILDLALPTARAAAALVHQGFRSGVPVTHKDRSDLVTEFDLRSEALIRAQFADCFPSHTVVGEEGGGKSAEFTWYVDPVDGTTNFAHGHPVFCVSMGLVHGDEPVVGITIAPALGLEWTASKGGGATRNGAPMRVSKTDVLDEALLSTGFPSWRHARSDNNYKQFLALDARTRGVRRCGAGAAELAMVADGTYDGFWDIGLKAWDICAAVVLIREAGGAVSAPDHAALDLHAGAILATNGRIHDALGKALSGPLELPPGFRTEAELRNSEAYGLHPPHRVG
jgi:myo-inositol-1(or 4)-monophosphatase